jgi:hypothetical protein
MKVFRASVLGALLLAMGVLAVPGQASAAPSHDSAVSSGLVPVYDAAHGTRMLPAAQAAPIITAYWTPARQAAAIMDATTVPDVRPDAAAAAAAAVPDASAKPKRVAAPATPANAGVSPNVVFTNTDGKVFYHDPSDNTDHACSGGAVNSGKKRLVITAGHCVHGGSGKQWMTNWSFDPGYQFGPGSAGVFPAFQLWAQSGWINNNDRHFDYGIAITQTNASGAKLVNAVGGNGLIINPGRPFVTAIAYPVNFNNAQQQAFCQGTLSRRNIFNSDQQLNCDLRFGASGGPWLQNYGDNGLGDIVSNQSYSLNTDGSGPEYGPYYDSDTAALYNAAENASP